VDLLSEDQGAVIFTEGGDLGFSEGPEARHGFGPFGLDVYPGNPFEEPGRDRAKKFRS
jgi:hypothetical protein